MKAHGPGGQRGQKRLGQPGTPTRGTRGASPSAPGPCVQVPGRGAPLPGDHHRLEGASRPPPFISPSIPQLSQLLPVLMEGKNFSFFLYFSRRVTRSGKEFPPPQTIIIPINRCHRSRPILLCWDRHSYFWALYGGGTLREGIWWGEGDLSCLFPVHIPLPGSSPPPLVLPAWVLGGGKEACLARV